MPKKSSDSKKSKGDEDTEVVLEYLKNQNRPFNDKMVFENLHGAVSKARVGKILDDCADAGTVIRKEFGKQKIYWINQNSFPSVSKEELDKLDTELDELKAELKEVQDNVKSLNAELSTLNASLSDEQLELKLLELTRVSKEQQSRLENLRANAETVSREDFDAARKAYQDNLIQWKRRKRWCMDILNQIMESSSFPLKKMQDKIGFELDEDSGMNPAQMEAKRNPASATKPPISNGQKSLPSSSSSSSSKSKAGEKRKRT